MPDKKNRKGFGYTRLPTASSKPRWKWCTALTVVVVTAVIALFAIAVIVALSVSLTLPRRQKNHIPGPSPVSSCQLSLSERFNCLPGITEQSHETCQLLGCCWNDSSPPFCYYSLESGYSVDEEFSSTQVGVRGCLARKQLSSVFGGGLQRLCVNVTFETDDRLHIKVYDPTVKRYEVPLEVPVTTRKAQQPKYEIELINKTFSFKVSRKDGSSTEIFHIAPGLVFTDQFIQLSAYLSSHNIYGLGEHVTSLRLPMDNSVFTLFAADIFPNPDVPAQNLYGVHPFYLGLEDDGKAHGVLLLNSNAMEVTLQQTPSITYRTTGGILDLYFFLGPSPEQVIQQYTEVVGRSFFPPYWSLGFHLCRWGYDSANNTWSVIKRMRELGIPQDVQWSDIDYMHDHLDFTYDHQSFGELPDMVEDIHEHRQRYVVITDPGISNHQPEGSYAPYDMGLEMNVFVRNSSGGLLVGRVWPDLTVYPDFTHPNASAYWEAQIQKFHENISFDGLWIDMNEPSNFETGSVDGCENTTLNYPPFLPGTLNNTGILYKTLCMSANQYASVHYNVHSLYGHTEAKATMNALERYLGERSLVISRSTFVGSGRYTGHWLGDNASQWRHMVNSIPGILQFSLFGIPMVGADICGFFDHPTEELCVRWQQLGAFYPFSRNHNIRDTPPQDPTVWSERAVEAIRDALLLRYSLLPYLYTLFYFAHVNGSTVARPIFFEFPMDSQTWSLDKQFMWGSALIISPVLEANVSSIEVYLPPSARWYLINSTYSSEEMSTSGIEVTSGHVTIPVSLSSILIHVKGGSIVPVQQSNTTTFLSRQNPYSIVVALDGDSRAAGWLFADDGQSLSGPQEGILMSFRAEKDHLMSTVQQQNSTMLVDLNTELAQVYVFGLSASPNSSVTLNNTLELDYTWDQSLKVLKVTFPPNTQHITSPFILDWNM